MFEDYDDIFGEPSEAEKIITNAETELKALFTEKVKKTIEEARKAQQLLDELQNKIHSAKWKLDTINDEIVKAENRQANAEMYDIPKKYIQRFVEKATGGYAPDDIVWVIKKERVESVCSICNGNKNVKAVICGGVTEIRCPQCNGVGKEVNYIKKVEKSKVSRVHLKLCFGDNRVNFWDTESVFLDRNEFSTKPEHIFPTEEAAQKALKGGADQ